MRHLRALIVLWAVLMLLLAAPAAWAGTKGSDRPFGGYVSGEARFDDSNPNGCGEPFFITTFTEAHGQSTLLGRTHVSMEHCPGFGTIEDGRVVFTAANGDELVASYEGWATDVNADGLITGEVDLTFDPDESTGRFAGAHGDLTMEFAVVFEGLDDPAWAWSGWWHGTLSY